ncbi:hypothetical protein K7432_002478 [Basidiobolus ranarum]|uniref:Uncharacterized protein n=1 Tax=Basidiobolus ranarum TaxID=34480 RepID=A0ABR2X1P7_9FUNG
MDLNELPNFPPAQGIGSVSSTDMTQTRPNESLETYLWDEDVVADEVRKASIDAPEISKTLIAPNASDNSEVTVADKPLNFNRISETPVHVAHNNAKFDTLSLESLKENTLDNVVTSLDDITEDHFHTQSTDYNTLPLTTSNGEPEDYNYPEQSTSQNSNYNRPIPTKFSDFKDLESIFENSPNLQTQTPYRSNIENREISESPNIFEISDSSFSHTPTPSQSYIDHPRETHIDSEESSIKGSSDNYNEIDPSWVDLTRLNRSHPDNLSIELSNIQKQKRRREETPEQVQQQTTRMNNSVSNNQVIDLTEDSDILDVLPHPTPSKRQRHTSSHSSYPSSEHKYPESEQNASYESSASSMATTEKRQPEIVDLTIIDSDEEIPTTNSERPLWSKAPFNADNTGFNMPSNFRQFTQYNSFSPSQNTSSNTLPANFSSEEVCFGMIRCLVLTTRRLLQPVNNPQVIEIDDDDDDENKLIIHRDKSNQQDPTCIKVHYKKGQELGYLERSSANGLAPLMDAKLIRVEGYLPRFRGKSNAFVTAVNLYLFGRKDAVQIVGNGLYSFGLHLSDPQEYVPDKVYLNPFNRQALPPQSSGPSQTPVDTLYQWLETPVNLPELEPDARLIPKLYKHQKQALYFLTEREKVNKTNHESGKFSCSLYKVISSKYNRKQVLYKHLVTDEEIYDQPNEPRGGLLADDMGLGKTISIIALILSTHTRVKEPEDYFSENDAAERDSQDGDGDFQSSLNMDEDFKVSLPTRTNSVPPIDGPREREVGDLSVQSRATLIICPLSVVANWEEQFSLHVKKNVLSVYVYHGNNRNTNPRALAKYDVVITTYNVLALEYSRSDKHGTKSPLQEVKWLRIVLDEAHVIKDISTIQSKAACNLLAERRWCLSGTPVQNKIDDLYSLVKFLQIPSLCEFPVWQHIFTRPLKNNENRAILRLQTLMKCITLRRVKTQEYDGKPILKLPPKRDIFAWLEFSEPEQKLYDKVATEAKEKVNKMLDAANPLRQYMNVLQWILKLRQICAHHSLCDTSVLNLEVENNAQLKEKAGLLLSIMRDSGDDKCQFCFQEVGEMPYLTKCEHIFCQSCAANLILNDFNKGKTSRFCPSCGVTLIKTDVVQVRGEIPDQSTQPCKIRPGLPEQSTKIQALIKALQNPPKYDADDEICEQDRRINAKSVVFSQWTSMLDLIEDTLKENHIQFARLDGKMNRVQRSLNIEKFRDSPQVTVILVSLKAGGVG